MREAAEAFITLLEEKTTLTPLYMNKTLLIEMKGGSETIWMKIAPKDLLLLDQFQLPEDIDTYKLIKLKADTPRSICELLTGKSPLLRKKEEGEVDVQGAFNDQLTLESLFLLASHHSFLIV